MKLINPSIKHILFRVAGGGTDHSQGRGMKLLHYCCSAQSFEKLHQTLKCVGVGTKMLVSYQH